jgi:protein YibB
MSTTLVTALFDIGRGEWNNIFKRSHEEYLSYFKNILSLNANFVIYIDERDLKTVEDIRKHIDPELSKTKIIVKKFEELEVIKKYLPVMRQVMGSQDFKQRLIESHTPESLYPEYNAINFNKVSFVSEVIEQNYFNSDYFMWIDAGYSHNNFPAELLGKIYPDNEKIKILDDNKVHFLSLCNEKEIGLKTYTDPRVSITGSMFAGRSKPLLEFKNICFFIIEEFLKANACNDDQAIYAMAYKFKKDLFNITTGNWFDNIKFYI